MSQLAPVDSLKMRMCSCSAAIRSHALLKGVTLPERLGTTGGGGLLVTQNGLILIGGRDPDLVAARIEQGGRRRPDQTGVGSRSQRSRDGG